MISGLYPFKQIFLCLKKEKAFIFFYSKFKNRCFEKNIMHRNAILDLLIEIIRTNESNKQKTKNIKFTEILF